MKKVLALALALFMLVSVFALVGCGDGDKETTTADNGGTTTTGSNTDNSTTTGNNGDGTTTADPGIEPIFDYNFNGKTFTFVVQFDTAGNGWDCYDIYTETTTGDIVNDAIWRRNAEVETMYNCKVRDYRVAGAASYMNDQVKIGSTAYDFVVAPNTLISYATSGNYYNLMNAVDTTAAWWDQALIRDTAIDGKIYGLTGAFSILDDEAMWVMFFNKDMLTGMESPYTHVKNNTWTWDTFVSMCELASDDVDDNDEMVWDIDTFGFATHNDSTLAFFASAGHRFCTVDAEGNAAITFGAESNEGDIMTDIIEIMTADWTMNANIVGCGIPNALRSVFTRGGALFYAEVLGSTPVLAEVENFKFGIVPFPKYDKNDDYYQRLNGNTMFVAIPTTANMQVCGNFLDAFSERSLAIVQHEYVERAIKTLYVSDTKVGEMLDLIIEKRTYDLGYTCNLGTLYSLYVGNVDEGKNVAVQIKDTFGGMAQDELDGFVEKIKNNKV